MVDPEAASVKIVDVPRLPVSRLLHLRAFLDSALACGLGEESPREGLMAKHWLSAQPDLFEEPPQGMRPGAAERAMAVEQLKCC
jgi:hypothetical protein